MHGGKIEVVVPNQVNPNWFGTQSNQLGSEPVSIWIGSEPLTIYPDSEPNPTVFSYKYPSSPYFSSSFHLPSCHFFVLLSHQVLCSTFGSLHFCYLGVYYSTNPGFGVGFGTFGFSLMLFGLFVVRGVPFYFSGNYKNMPPPNLIYDPSPNCNMTSTIRNICSHFILPTAMHLPLSFQHIQFRMSPGRAAAVDINNDHDVIDEELEIPTQESIDRLEAEFDENSQKREKLFRTRMKKAATRRKRLKMLTGFMLWRRYRRHLLGYIF